MLAFVGLLWLVPTIGLFVDLAARPGRDQPKGWWEILSKPSKATFENYENVFDNAHDHVVALARR